MYDTQEKHFQQLLAVLDESGGLPAIARQSRMPEPRKVLSRLMELGVTPAVLTQSLAKVFQLEVYDPNKHGEFNILNDDKQWGISGHTFFIVNPFARDLYPAVMLTMPDSIDVDYFGLLPSNFSDNRGDEHESYAEAKHQIMDWIAQAYRLGGSDVHIAPLSADYVRVRTRVDGQLRLLDEIPSQPVEAEKSYRYISNMLMRLAGMEAGVFVKPADGSFNMNLASEMIEVRLSMRPVVVRRQPSQAFYLRLFSSRYDQRLTRISALGLPAGVEQAFAETRKMNQNLVLITGPTGSGKSTTLYANLREMLYETPGRSIQTLEDPVECHIDGIEQTEINERSGMSFEAGLRNMMRSDVDVILVGEVRDAETASLAVRASLTGHLVFATVHTKTALAAIERLVDFGVSRKMLATVLAAVFAQRLVRKLCPICKGQGQCVHCEDGYAGRCPIAEFIGIEGVLRAAIIQDDSLQQMEALIRRQGHETLWDCADDLIRRGITTLSECRTQLPQQYSVPASDHHLSRH